LPTAEAKTVIKADSPRVWAFLKDLKNVGYCLGVVEEVITVDGGRARWILKSQQARTTRTREVEAQFTVLEANKRIAWKTTGGNLTIEGDCELEPRDGVTESKIKLTFDISGPLGAVMRPMISMTIDSRLEAFIQCLKGSLEK